jgi:hypothetical protein
MAAVAEAGDGDVDDRRVQSLDILVADAWEKQALLARGFKRIGRHSEYAI